MSKKLAIIFIVAFVFRLLISTSFYHGDLNNNISWGTIAYENGLKGFYGSSDANDWPYSAPNQPPLTILTFTGSRMIWLVIENASWWLNDRFHLFPSQFIWFWESKGMIYLTKLPVLLSDIGIAWLIYKYLIEKKKSESSALILASVWLFNPVTWYNSAIWGQTDSVVNLLGLMAILFLLKKDLLRFSITFTLSILFKGSLIIFLPILAFVAFTQKHAVKDWLKAFVASLLTIILISFWFNPKLNFFYWLVDLYKDRILPGEIGYLTANAFNFWWLVDQGKVMDSNLYYGVAARIWGFVIFLIGTIMVLKWLKPKKLSDKRIFFALMFMSLTSFLFMTRIHERYLYPLFPYTTLALGLIPGVIVPYAVLSVTHLLNLYHLFWAPPIPGLEALYLNPSFMQILSLINLLVYGYLLRHLYKAKI